MFDHDEDESLLDLENKKRRRRRRRRPYESVRERRKRGIIMSVVGVICLASSLYLLKDPIMQQIHKMMPSTYGAGDVEEQNTSSSSVIIEKRKPTILDSLLTEYPELSKVVTRFDKYPRTVIDLILKNQETIPYVADFIDEYPKNDFDLEVDIESSYTEGEIPLFMQWDKQWGYHLYGDNAMGFTGCGPVTLSMAYVYLTGDTSMHPLAMAKFAKEEGYMRKGSGSSWTLISKGGVDLGLKVTELILTKNKIISNLEKGKIIIAIMGKGDFTQRGHFILLRGVDEEGKILVNDSNSIANTNKSWDIDVFMKQTKNLWLIEKQ